MGDLKTSKTFLLPNPIQVNFENKEELREFLTTLVRVLTDLAENNYDDLEMLSATKQDK